MLRTSFPNMKRAWILTHGSKSRCDFQPLRYFPGQLNRVWLSKAEKHTNTGKESDAECKLCKQITEYFFCYNNAGETQKINQPPVAAESQNNQQNLLTTTSGINNTKKISLMSNIDTNDESKIGNRTNKTDFGKDETDITRRNDVNTLQATTAKQTEEQLAQKIEIIDETPLVEAEKKKVDGLNVNPKVLGVIVEINVNIDEDNNQLVYEHVFPDPTVNNDFIDIEDTTGMREKIDSLVRRIENAQILQPILPGTPVDVWQKPILNFAADDCDHQSGGSTKGTGDSDRRGRSGRSIEADERNEIDSLAKRCLNTPTSRIDQHLLNEMKSLGVPPSFSDLNSTIGIQMGSPKKPRKPGKKTDTDIEAVKLEHGPNTSSASHYNKISGYNTTLYGDIPRDSEQTTLTSQGIYAKHTDYSDTNKNSRAEDKAQPNTTKSTERNDFSNQSWIGYGMTADQAPLNRMGTPHGPTYHQYPQHSQHWQYPHYSSGNYTYYDENRRYLESFYYQQNGWMNQNQYYTHNQTVPENQLEETSNEDNVTQPEPQLNVTKPSHEDTSQEFTDEATICVEQKIPIQAIEMRPDLIENEGIPHATGHSSSAAFNIKPKEQLTAAFYSGVIAREHHILETPPSINSSKEHTQKLFHSKPYWTIKKTAGKGPNLKSSHASQTLWNEVTLSSRKRKQRKLNKYGYNTTQVPHFMKPSQEGKASQVMLNPVTLCVDQKIPIQAIEMRPDLEGIEEFSELTEGKTFNKSPIEKLQAAFDSSLLGRELKIGTPLSFTQGLHDSEPHLTNAENKTDASQSSLRKINFDDKQDTPTQTTEIRPAPKAIETLTEGSSTGFSKGFPPTQCYIGLQTLQPVEERKEKEPELLSEMLKRVRLRNRMELMEAQQAKMDRVQGKCRKRGGPPCPPPSPVCPPPPPCQPPPCPPPPPPCPRPCKPACPQRPCPPCQPPKNPCSKCKGISLEDVSNDIVAKLLGFNTDRIKSSVPITFCNKEESGYVKDVGAKADLTNGVMAQLQVMSCHLFSSCRKRDFGIHDWDLENLALARSFEPWVPIPSWPIPKKVDVKKLVCPKEGCKEPPPPRLDTPCEKGGDPCKGFPKRLNMSELS